MEESGPELSPNHKSKNIKDIVLKTGLWYNIIRNQVRRMGEYMLMECKAYLGGAVCRYEVNEKMPETMAKGDRCVQYSTNC